VDRSPTGPSGSGLKNRALRMAEAISARLGGVAYDHFPDRPVRMHRSTYERLQRRHDKLVRMVENDLDATPGVRLGRAALP
jgi:hypothetical protein